MDYRKQAYYIRDVLGGNPIPLNEKKKSKILWKHLQTQKITNTEIEKHFADCGGIALGTGTKISPFMLIDFDLNKQLEGQHYFEAYMERVPENLKKRLLCNTTQSGVGRHIWVKTDYIAKTMHLARRFSTIEEFNSKYNEMVKAGKSPEKAMKTVLRNPYEVVIETKHRDSYAVLTHPKYKRVFGDTIHFFEEEEAKTLLEIGMTLDCGYTRPETYGGNKEFYRIRNTFNEQATADEMLDLIVGSGSFKYVGKDYAGNHQALRHGSGAGHSLTIFKDTGKVQVFSPNTIFGETGTYSPFTILCVCMGFEELEGIEYVKRNYDI